MGALKYAMPAGIGCEEEGMGEHEVFILVAGIYHDLPCCVKFADALTALRRYGIKLAIEYVTSIEPDE